MLERQSANFQKKCKQPQHPQEQHKALPKVCVQWDETSNETVASYATHVREKAKQDEFQET